jgi:hypothetical protein
MIMKNILITAMGFAAFAASPALAQSSTGTVSIDGSVADRCLFTTPSATISLGEISLSGTGTTAGKLNTAKVDGQSRTLVGWCNGTAATMTVEAQPLLNISYTGPAVAGFDTRVNYAAKAVANAVEGTDTSTGVGAGAAVAVGLFTGDIPVTLSASSSPTNGLLVAGTYQGQVLVTLTPNVSFGPIG